MANDMRQLAIWCNELPAKLKAAGNARKKDVVLTIENALTQTTPIDEGYAISNWQVSLHDPLLDNIDPYFPTKKGADNGAALNAQGAMDVAREVVGLAQPGDTVYIANALPYIGLLNEDGTSPQAEPGFVERAIMLGEDVASRAKLDP